MSRLLVLLTLLALALAPAAPPAGAMAPAIARLLVTSPAFSHNRTIPTTFTCDGADTSPPLSWRLPPAAPGRPRPDVKAWAVVCDDPDAPSGTWTHWVVWNVPGAATGLPAAVPTEERLADGTRQGMNSWKQRGYRGPAPPSGIHRYFFKVFGLSEPLGLAPNATRADLGLAMRSLVVAKGQLVGRFGRTPAQPPAPR